MTSHGGSDIRMFASPECARVLAAHVR